MSDIIDSKSLAILHVSLHWKSDFASHVETFYVPLNVWRELELLPDSLAQALAGQRAGSVCKTSFGAGSLVPAHDKSQVRRFPQESSAHGRVVPRLGRFYPRGLLPGYAQNPTLLGARQSTMASFLPILTIPWLNRIWNSKSLWPRCKRSGLIPAGFAMTGFRLSATAPVCKFGTLKLPRISFPTTPLPGAMTRMMPGFTESRGWSTTLMPRPTPSSAHSMGVC